MGYQQKLNTNPAPVTSFSDTFVRADKDSLGANWVTMNFSGSVSGVSATAFGSISSNKAKFIGKGSINPVSFQIPIFVPIAPAANLYTATKMFVEVVFDSVAGTTGPGLALRANNEILNGETNPPGPDIYIMVTNGRIDKIIGGGAQNTIGASTWVVAAGDTIRFEVENVGTTSVKLRSIRNGVTLQEVTDAASFSLRGYGGVIIYTMGGTPALDNFIIRSFNTGTF